MHSTEHTWQLINGEKDARVWVCSSCLLSSVSLSISSPDRFHPLQGRAWLHGLQRADTLPFPPRVYVCMCMCVCVCVCLRATGLASRAGARVRISSPKHPPILPGYCGGSGRGRRPIGRFSDQSTAIRLGPASLCFPLPLSLSLSLSIIFSPPLLLSFSVNTWLYKIVIRKRYLIPI